MAETAAKDNPIIKTSPPLVQTAEDAAMAYMRGEITEDELRQVCAAKGVLPGQLMHATKERPDAAFEKKLPADLYDPAREPTDDVTLRTKLAEIKAETREAATTAHEEAAKELEKPTTVAQSAELQTQQQELAQKEGEELAAAVEEATPTDSTGDSSSSTTTTPTKSTATTTKSTSS